MSSGFRVRIIDLMVLAGILGLYVYGRGMPTKTMGKKGPSDFAQSVNLTPLYKTAVQADGRVRSFESHAKAYMGYVSGPRTIHGQSNGFTYLDLLLRPENYDDVDLIYIKNKLVRTQLVDVVAGLPDVEAARIEAMRKTGLVARRLIRSPEVIALLQRLGQDLIRTAKSVDAIQSALNVSDPRFLSGELRIVATPSGRINEPWISLTELLASSSGVPQDATHSGMGSSRPIPGLDQELQEQIVASWRSLESAWRAEDAVQVNAQIALIAALAPTVSPNLYPSAGRLEMESWYFRHKSMTWVWFFYLAAVIPLLMSTIYKWNGARKVGMVLFVVAFAMHTATLGVRWYISGRWPNSNMFEAVTTSAWFGGVLAIILERVTRKTAFRNLFALGSAVVSMTALMAAYFLPAQLNSAISNKMAALNDIWLYIHTNMIISSYAVIGLACVPALLQLRYRWCKAWDHRAIPKLRLILLPIAVVILNYTGFRLLMHAMSDPVRELSRSGLLAMTGAGWGAFMIVLLEATAARNRRKAGIGLEQPASGGASAVLAASPRGSSFLVDAKPTLGQVYDGATMVLVELAFIMLWTGTVMGAIWADHSWGRPWGWDPKEVFALNTFIIFLILIHVRLKVKDKAFWTAILAVVGFEVMMFNWIVVNFVISGLHSYA